MSVDLHRQAERRMAAADAAKSAGDFASAAVEIAMAGLREAEAFERIPTDRAKTRGAIAVSAVACYYHAAGYALQAGLERAADSYRQTAALYAGKYRALEGSAALPEWALFEIDRMVPKAPA